MGNGRTLILILWLIGVLAAAQLAKIAVLAVKLAETFGLSIATTGLLISLLEIGGALFGLAAGVALGRIGARRSLAAGLAVLAATGVAEAYAATASALLAARAAEGLGYLLVVIAAPTLIAATASERDRAAALSLWSTFVAVGMAVGSVVTGVAFTTFGLRGALLLWSLFSALAMFAVLRLSAAAPSERQALVLPGGAAWIATFGFGLYTSFICALTMLFPSFLVEQARVSSSVAGIATGIVALASVPGAVVAIVLARLRCLDRKPTIAIVAGTLFAAAAAALQVFTTGSAPKSILWASAAWALWISFASGIASPIVFGRLPMLAGARSATDPRIALANGLITQFGAGGALLGPPVGGLVVMRWGWGGLGLLVAALALATLCALVAAELISARAGARPATPEDRPSWDWEGALSAIHARRE
ncbi:MFS transporter [Sphingomonas psychrotolerans]|uniref:MFS transporter n=1 Tax=Sphingomonas psychrotolerans TaxID=1327635 RepID=A0ABU3N2L6_9SPHN|nr:MFS transporter [Sphingomonas psychrotolerans]MDT8758785.1 MFS transporter [Sphingomonas psychrotolerans]